MAIFRPTITFHKPNPVNDKELNIIADSGVTSQDVTLAGSNLPIVKELEFKYDAIDVNPMNKLLEYMSYIEIVDALQKAASGGSIYRLDFDLDRSITPTTREDIGVFKNTLRPIISFTPDEIPLTCTLELSTTGIWDTFVEDAKEEEWYRSTDYSSYTQTLPNVMDFPRDLVLPYNAKDQVYCRYSYSVWYKDEATKTMKFKDIYKSKTYILNLDSGSYTQEYTSEVDDLKARLSKALTDDRLSVDRIKDYAFKVTTNQGPNITGIHAEGREGDYDIKVNFKLDLNTPVCSDLFISNLVGIEITSSDSGVKVHEENMNLDVNEYYGSVVLNDVRLSTESKKSEIILNVTYLSTEESNNQTVEVRIYPSYPVAKNTLTLDPNNLLHGTEEFLKLRDDVAPAYVGFRNIFYYNDIPSKTVKSTWEVLDNGVVVYSLVNDLIPSTLGIFTFNSFRKGSYVDHKDLETLQKLSLLFPNVKFSKEPLTDDEIEEYSSSDVYTGLPYGSSIFTKDTYTMRVTFYNKDNDTLGIVEKDFHIDNRYNNCNTNRTDLYNLNCYKLPFLTKDKASKYIKLHNGYKYCRPTNSLLSVSQPLHHEDSYVYNFWLYTDGSKPENIQELYLASPYFYNNPKYRDDANYVVFRSIYHLAEMIHSMTYFEDPGRGEIRRPITISLGINGDYFKAIYKAKVTDTIESVKQELIKLGVLNVIKDPNLNRDERFITVSVYPSEGVLSQPLFVEVIPYVLEEEIESDTRKEYIVNGDTKELKIFKDNFNFQGLVRFEDCTDLSLTGFKGVYTPTTKGYYKGQEVVCPKNHSLYLCIKNTDGDKPLTDENHFVMICKGDKAPKSLDKDFEKYYGLQVPTLTALSSYLNVMNNPDCILNNDKDYDLKSYIERHNREYIKSKTLGKEVEDSKTIEYNNLLGYWFKLKNLNNYKVLYYSSKPMFWCKDKNTLVKLGLTHPRNNLIRVGLKYYYVRLVTDVYNPEDDCCIESLALSGVPNNSLDFTSFNTPNLENARESIISYDVLKELINSTDLEDKSKEELKSSLDVYNSRCSRSNLVYSAIPKDKEGNRYLNSEDILSYNIHMTEELSYDGELSEKLYHTDLEKQSTDRNVEDTPYKDYYPVHIVLEEVDERELPIYNLKEEIKSLVGEIGINVDTLKQLSGSRYTPELNGYDVVSNKLFPSLDPISKNVYIPHILHGGYVNNVIVDINYNTGLITRDKHPRLSYDRWSMTGYLGMLPITAEGKNIIFSQLEKVVRDRVKNNDIVREEENNRQPIVHVFYFKGKVLLVPTDHLFITKDEFIKYGRAKPLDALSKDVERVKIGSMVFDVSLHYLMKGV